MIAACRDVTWQMPTPPREPQGECGLKIVNKAYLTPFERGDLRVVHGPFKWIRGAAYTPRGGLMPRSQRLNVHDVKAPLACDPKSIDPPTDAIRVEGSWIYGGHWMPHFGHYLTETLPSLWPDPAEIPRLDGLVFHRSWRGQWSRKAVREFYEPTVEPWQRDLIALAGYGTVPVRLHNAGTRQFDRLVVPSRPLVHKSWAYRDVVPMWQRMAAAAGTPGPDRLIYLSRTRFNAADERDRRNRTTGGWDDELDATFAAAGFVVVHPEELRIVDQVRVVAGADVLAGSSGSALHLSAFAPQSTRVIEVGDRRARDGSVPTQRVIDSVIGRTVAFLSYGDQQAVRVGLGKLMETRDVE
jgi:capsular polysaccharide biosynthesis protein